MHIIKLFSKTYRKYYAVQLEFVCLINPLNLSNLPSTKNSTTVKPTVKDKPTTSGTNNRKPQCKPKHVPLDCTYTCKY